MSLFVAFHLGGKKSRANFFQSFSRAFSDAKLTLLFFTIQIFIKVFSAFY